MCEITSDNFYSELPVIEAAINESSFISIDMEFSKIDDIIYQPFSYFDIPKERYSLLRKKVSDITCIQFGLSIFTYDITKKTFNTRAYSIYTFPQTFCKSNSEVHFQISCMEFLNRHKFDFNKLFSRGVPYLTDEQEIMIKLEMSDDLFFENYFENTSRFIKVKIELDKILKIISTWYDNAKYGETQFFKTNECSESACIILMQYYLLKNYKNILIHEVKSGLNITKVKQINDVDLLNNSLYKKNLKQSLFDNMMGIKYLLKLLFKLKKPLIGHNCSLDLLILCNQFFEPLPENFKDFQIFVSRNFGPIYDTKLLCKELKRVIPKNYNWKGNSLPEIYSFLTNGDGRRIPILINIELSGIKEPQETKFHDAGWDAYYTGYCFIRIVHIIKCMSNKRETDFQTFNFTEFLKIVEPFKNKFYTQRSITNFIDLKTDSHENQINYLIIQNKGMFYKSLDVNKLTSRLKEVCAFDIKLLSNYTALIVSPCRNKRIIDGLKSEYMVDEYSDYQRRRKNQYIVGLSLMICTPIIILLYLKK
ncbi:Ribonuclease H-like domain,Ribonuclease CAF1 [Cinara cedri]|uniref:Ribonuclease H-like domain,Ribonuclease CAF1 n=1 Tax=Cinara cedri TaxID=506608 RepID=A0A5E4MDU8_9HEMI|nr:Ribonuclease H-like domain,Ribonuclease CAF1 [Cinara cedri]